MSALVVSNLLLWVAVLVLAGLVFALVRQVGVLHERIAPAGALVVGDGPKVGEPAPRLEVAALDGARLALGGPDPDGRGTLLLFVSPTCPVCKTLLPVARRVARDEGRALRLVLASDGPIEEHAAFVAREGLAEVPYVVSMELGLAHRVGRLPWAVIVDAEGIVRARGLVSSREHLESLFEAWTRGVASIQDHLAAGRGEAGGRPAGEAGERPTSGEERA